MSRTVATVCGWAEGPWLSKQLLRRLEANGFENVDSPIDVDVIVAHSLGCYRIPKGARAEHIVLIGLPIWPGRTSLDSLCRKLVGEIKYHAGEGSIFWLGDKLLHNLYYLLRYPTVTLSAAQRNKWPQIPPATKVVVIHNSEDSFSQKKAIEKFATQRGYTYTQLPGLHDDIWTNPKPYVDILSKL